jgi:hypothetical protein
MCWSGNKEKKTKIYENMTIQTDNPLLQLRLWMYDILWQYWPIVLLLAIIAVWLMYRRFKRDQRAWDERMLNERKEIEEFKQKAQQYGHMFENDTVEVNLNKLRPITMQPLTDEEKKELVMEVMDGFDFKTVQRLMRMQGKVRTLEELKEDAEHKLRMTLDHRDREFWWAGGLAGYGGIAACYDNKWGLSLNYIAVSNKVRTKK